MLKKTDAPPGGKTPRGRTPKASSGRAISPSPLDPMQDPQRLLHELQVHQIELETQNLELRQARDALEIALAHYAELYDSSPVSYFTLDSLGQILRANFAGANLLGLARSHLSGRNFGQFVSPGDRDAWAGFLATLLAAQSKTVCELSLETKHGRLRTLAEGVSDGSGSKCRLALLDITARKQAEEALRLSQDNYRSMVEDQLELVSRFTPEGRLTYVNQSYCRFFGKRAEDILGNTWRPLVIEDDLPLIEERLAQLSPEMPVAVIENRVRNAMGELRWVQFSNRALFNAQGVLREIQSVGRDVHERKQAEEALRESEQRLRGILHTALDGYWLTDLQGRLLQVNASYCRMSGYSEAELLGLCIADLEANETPEDVASRIREAVVQGSGRFETRHRRKDGSIFDVEVSFQYKPFDNGQLVLFQKDISSRKKAERFRESVERIIRHDIKAPLVGLHTMAELAFADGMDDDFRSFIPGLMHAIQQVIKLLGSSEKIRQMEQGGYTVKARWFDMRDVLGSIGQSLDGLIKAHRTRLVISGMPAPDAVERPPLFFGEEFLIEDMLMNLAKNAVEASPKESLVTIACDFSPTGQRIVIHNFGMVPEAVRDTFFAKYSSVGKPHGTGLGTFSAWLIARAHGGDISFATSEAEGTTVTVLLPCPAEERPSLAPKKADPF